MAAAEFLPYRSNYFDTIISNEVIEHVADDREAMREMIRVLKPGGRAVIFCPNRWYPFETHGHYWQGEYHFGNTPLINYLPDSLRDRLAPHVRAYTRRGLFNLLEGCPAQVVHHSRIYGGYDNIVRRFGKAGESLRGTLQGLEGTPLDVWGLSHLLVLEKTG
jgi:SAM-dependent methyltransferase